MHDSFSGTALHGMLFIEKALGQGCESVQSNRVRKRKDRAW